MSANDESGDSRESNVRFAVYIAAAAGAFCLFVLAGLAANYHQARNLDPLRDRTMAGLMQKLKASPDDESIKTEIRQRDQLIRYEVFRSQSIFGFGAWMLICGATVFFLSAGCAAAARRTIPKVDSAMKDPQAEISRRRGGSVAVFAASVLLLGGAAYLKMHPPEMSAVAISQPTTSQPSVTANSLTKFAYVPPTQQAIAEYMRQWPRFYGPAGTGNVAGSDAYPTKWAGESGEGILWKAKFDLPGQNSPVVWGDRIFITGADEKTQRVFCFSLADGKELWRRDCKPISVHKKPPDVNEDTGYAASTAATDGKRVFVIFATGDLYCLNAADGVEVWSKGVGPFDNTYGYASSLATWGNLLIVQLDQASASSGLSAIVAFDTQSGAEVWRAGRKVGSSWATPIVARMSGVDCVIAAANPLLTANALADGKELWQVKCLDADLAPSPTFDGTKVYAAVYTARLSAIKLEIVNGAIKPSVAWTSNDGLPDIVTPLAGAGRLWTLSSGGNLICYNTADGEKIYEHEMEGVLQASPILVGQKIYLFKRDGQTVIINADGEYKELANNKIEEIVAATPAFVGGKIIIRGESTLYCIGVTSGAATTAGPTSGSAPAVPTTSPAKMTDSAPTIAPPIVPTTVPANLPPAEKSATQSLHPIRRPQQATLSAKTSAQSAPATFPTAGTITTKSAESQPAGKISAESAPDPTSQPAATSPAGDDL